MSEYKLEEILIPFDFSERSISALKEVAWLAGKSGAKLYAFHSFKRPGGSKGSHSKQNQALFEHKLQKIRNDFEEISGSKGEMKDVELEFIAEAGISRDHIIDLVKGKKIDLIVSATHGVKGLEYVTGTKTQKLIHELKGPIVAIPDGKGLRGIKKMALAVDLGSRFELDVVEPFFELAKIIGAKTYVFEVLDHNLPSAKDEKRKQDFFDRLGIDPGSVTIEEVYNSDKEEGIRAFAKTFDIDMLGLIPLHRNPIIDLFHDSLSEKLAGTAKIPVMTLAKNYEFRKL